MQPDQDSVGSAKENQVIQKILKYLCFEIKEDDNLPKDICLSCYEKIEAFHKFFEEVSQNQTMLAYAQTQNSPVIITSAAPPILDPNQKSITMAHHQLQEFIKIEDISGSHIDLQSLSAGGPVPTTIAVISSVTFNNGTATTNYTLQPVTQALQGAFPIVANAEPLPEPTPMAKEDLADDMKKGANKVEDSPTQARVRRKRVKEKPGNTTQISENLAKDDEMESEAWLKMDDLTEDTKEDEEPRNDHFENIEFPNFPKKIIQDTKLLIRGKALISLMSKFYRLDCDLCAEGSKGGKKVFKKLSVLCNHYTEVHNIKGYVICCGVKLIKPRAMAMHMARHLQPEAFRCPECSKMMTCPKILQYHVQNHLPEEKRPLACPDCPRRFSYSSALVAHSISHQPESQRAAHVCDECGKTFSSPGRLSTHINVAHTKQGISFVCHVCAKQFACKGNLTYHLTTHQPRVHQVQCQQCGKWLKNKLCLRKHMVQHSMVRFNCDLCEYSALNRQCLRNHVRVQHTDLKPFCCSQCGRTFKLKNTLLNHMVQHTGLKKFSCQFCSRTFASSGNYYSHRKRMHPTELADFNRKREEEENILRAKALAGKLSS
ncbi:zinc finger protein with KRAB and SCAN domains 7-like isoform X2 [Phlebotomus argentipes]|uniref:zinc finger protein with KRAB and SCAN domains 7-like isoform X2 n=1 Tax=Phlebotomus argentipes TaxID=94469 RepID=UPI002892F4B9|nr:zinc finger protein with KRAB and SCAN domains 7-like isoform X2 [Phlebotomus argentipes]